MVMRHDAENPGSSARCVRLHGDGEEPYPTGEECVRCGRRRGASVSPVWEELLGLRFTPRYVVLMT